MSKRTTSASQSSSQPNDHIIDNNWDGGQLGKKRWRTLLKPQLPLLHGSFPTMWERAFLFERSTIITVTTEHAYQMSIDNISICMFEEPCNPHSLKLKDAGKTYAAALKAAQVQDNMVNATSASSSASLASS